MNYILLKLFWSMFVLFSVHWKQLYDDPTFFPIWHASITIKKILTSTTVQKKHFNEQECHNNMSDSARKLRSVRLIMGTRSIERSAKNLPWRKQQFNLCEASNNWTMQWTDGWWVYANSIDRPHLSTWSYLGIGSAAAWGRSSSSVLAVVPPPASETLLLSVHHRRALSW